DGFVAGEEECDDGNLMNNDGCSSTCLIQTYIASSSSSSSFSSSSASSSSAVCGNGTMEIGEQCENNMPCAYGYSCADCFCIIATFSSSSRSSSRSSSSSSSSSSSQSSSASAVPLCGNGILESGEQCENASHCPAGWTCLNTCQCFSLTVAASSSSFSTVRVAASASSSSSVPPPLSPVCGNGILETGEQCDQGITCPENLFCAAGCQCQPIMALSSASSMTAEAMCGNGVLEEGEGCDDGNLLPFDGCAYVCQVETGHSCFGEPSACQPVCGDSVRIPPEQCDDGNLADGDGCSSVCEVEYAAAEDSSDSSASSVSSVSLALCGNGMLEEGEQCDDANLLDGDGCSALCLLEQISSASSISFISSASSASSFVPMPTPEPAGTGFTWWWVVTPLLLVVIVVMGWMMVRRGEE
ncbi:MAG: DUF4215 domain-containing protein, partial [Candidatus Peribacteraceae bacterium]|nr:DUF4215 domain-containing protein [Candidatus Peribacteraceae bacterium]